MVTNHRNELPTWCDGTCEVCSRQNAITEKHWSVKGKSIADAINNMAVEFENAPQIEWRSRHYRDVVWAISSLDSSNYPLCGESCCWQQNLRKRTQVKTLYILWYYNWSSFWRYTYLNGRITETYWPWRHRYHRSQPMSSNLVTTSLTWDQKVVWRWSVELWYTRGSGKEQRELHFASFAKSLK